MKLILNDEIVKVYENKENQAYNVFIRLSAQDGWIEHNPFPGNLQGKIAAMSLATDCMAGKFFPATVTKTLPGEAVGIEHKPLTITHKNRGN
jgi:hypothetical protein